MSHFDFSLEYTDCTEQIGFLSVAVANVQPLVPTRYELVVDDAGGRV